MELTDTQYELADKITLWLEAHAGSHTRSAIARGCGVATHEAAAVLESMEQHTEVAAAGNGSWKRYAAR